MGIIAELILFFAVRLSIPIEFVVLGLLCTIKSKVLLPLGADAYAD
jgi:hypothetical protein